MSQYVVNPLTDAHCKDLDRIIQDYPALKATLDALERCGMNCEQRREALQTQFDIASKIKREFNPLAP